MKTKILLMLYFVAALAVGMFAANEAVATNGYFSHGYGTHYKGMAGAGVAFPLGTMTAAVNPAGMVRVGNRYDIDLALFSPDREYTVSGNPSQMEGTFGLTPGTVVSESKMFAIPDLGVNRMLDKNSSVGVSIYGNGGMNTDYQTSTFYGTSPTGVDLAQIFAAATYAREVTSLHSFGLTGIFAYQRFRAQGMQAYGNFSSDAANLTDNDHDNSIGFGARIGYLGEWMPWLSVGASFKTKIYMGELDEYAGLFAEQGDFDIPASWVAGVAVEPLPDLTVLADVQQVLYDEITAVGNPMNPANFQQGILLGNDNGSGFGWENMTTVKFGVQWEGLENTDLRAGFSFGEQPIPDSEVMFNILAPGVIEQHITAGASHRLSGGQEISIAIMHGFSKSISGANPMEVPGQQTIELKMNQWEGSVGFSF